MLTIPYGYFVIDTAVARGIISGTDELPFCRFQVAFYHGVNNGIEIKAAIDTLTFQAVHKEIGGAAGEEVDRSLQ